MFFPLCGSANGKIVCHAVCNGVKNHSVLFLHKFFATEVNSDCIVLQISRQNATVSGKYIPSQRQNGIVAGQFFVCFLIPISRRYNGGVHELIYHPGSNQEYQGDNNAVAKKDVFFFRFLAHLSSNLTGGLS